MSTKKKKTGVYQPPPTTPLQAKQLKKLLTPFRRREQRNDLAVVVDNRDAINLLSAWSPERVVWKPATKKVPASNLWDWFWAGTWWDDDLLVYAELKASRMAELLPLLITARLVYPDGTISKHAKELVTKHVDQRFPGRVRGRPAGSKDKTKRAPKATK